MGDILDAIRNGSRGPNDQPVAPDEAHAPEGKSLWEHLLTLGGDTLAGGGIGASFGGVGAVPGAVAGFGLGVADWLTDGVVGLDTAGRFARTALHTGGDLGAAANAVIDPSSGATSEDLLRDVGYETQKAGDDRSWGRAFQDFGANALAGAVTDPLMYASAGATRLGSVAESAGAEAVSLARQGNRAGALAAIESKGLANASERLANGGVLPKLSQRLASGEASIRFAGIPVVGKAAAPLVGLVEKGGDVFEQTVAGVSPKTAQWIRSVGEFFSEKSGNRGMDILNQQIGGSMDRFTAEQLAPVVKARNELVELGFKESDMHYMNDIVHGTMNQEYASKLAKITGKDAGELTAMFERKLSPKQAIAELSQKYTPEQIQEFAKKADVLTTAYKNLLEADKLNGIKDVVDLGGGALSNLNSKKTALVDRLTEHGVPGNRLYGPGGEMRDLSKLLDEPEFKYLLKDKSLAALKDEYNNAVRIAAEVPGYVPLRVSADAMPYLMDFAKNDPAKWRQLTNFTGSIATEKEAQQVVQVLGTAALAGKSFKGAIDVGDMGRAWISGFKKDGLEGVAKKIAEVAEKNGKMFEDNPWLIYGDRLRSTARGVGQTEYVTGIRNMLGKDLPEELPKLYDSLAAKEAELRALHEGAGRIGREQPNLPGLEGVTEGEKGYNLGSVTYKHGGLPYDQPGLFGDSYQGYGGQGAARAVEGKAIGQAQENLFGETVHGAGPMTREGMASTSQSPDFARISGDVAYDTRAGVAKQSGSVPMDGTTARLISDKELELAQIKASIEKKLEYGQPGINEGRVSKGQALASNVFTHLKGTEKDFLIPSEVAEQINRSQRMMGTPGLYVDSFKLLKGFTQQWKELTLASPTTIIRNKIGNLFLRAQQGGIDAASILDEGKILLLQKALKAKDVEGEASKILFDIGGGKQITGWELVNRAKELGGIDSGFWAKEFRDPIQTGLGKRGLLGKIKDAPQATMAAIENGDKMGHMLARVRGGDSWEQAAYSANTALFNYHVVSPAVQLLRQTGLAPFAAWSAKNIPLQLQMLATHPGQFAAMLHAKHAIEAGVPGVSDEQLPGYVKDKFAVTYRKDEQGNPQFVTLEGVIPAADLPKMEDQRAFWSGMLGPLPKLGMEWLSNKDLFTQRNIKEFDGQVKPLLGLDQPVAPITAKIAEELIPHSSVIKQAVQYVRGTPKDIKDPNSAPKTTGMDILMNLSPLRPQTGDLRKDTMYNTKAIQDSINGIKREIRNNANNPRLKAEYTKVLEEKTRQLAKEQGKRQPVMP